MARPDRPISIILPGDDPQAAAENADLAEALLAGRAQVAVWQGDVDGRPRIVVLLGPVPQGTLVVDGPRPRPEGTVRREGGRDSNLVAGIAAVGIGVGIVLALGGLLALSG